MGTRGIKRALHSTCPSGRLLIERRERRGELWLSLFLPGGENCGMVIAGVLKNWITWPPVKSE